MIRSRESTELIGKICAVAITVVGAYIAIISLNKFLGLALMAAAMVFTLLVSGRFARYYSVVILALSVICLSPVDTDIRPLSMLTMSTFLAVAVGLPLFITRVVYKEKVIRFPVGRHTWTTGHVGYLLLAAVLSYLLLPLWMSTTGEYQNWSVPLNPRDIGLLFLGTNGLGIWDELFFIITILALLRKIMPFWLANLLQACFFTIFLYELGFQGWAPLAIYPFALLQGIVFQRTENLVYIIAIHLTIDFVLFLALINAHHPQYLNIFIT